MTLKFKGIVVSSHLILFNTDITTEITACYFKGNNRIINFLITI